MGTIITVILYLITLMFSYNKIRTIAEKNDVDIMTAINENAIDQSEEFTADDGFFIAAALT